MAFLIPEVEDQSSKSQSKVISTLYVPFSLASHTLTRGERVWSNCYSRVVLVIFSRADFSAAR